MAKAKSVKEEDEPIVLPTGREMYGRMNRRDWKVLFNPNTPTFGKKWEWFVRDMRSGGIFAKGSEASRNSAVNAAQEQTTIDFPRQKLVDSMYAS